MANTQMDTFVRTSASIDDEFEVTYQYYTYYIEKTAYSLSNAQKQQKLNVINYKHEYMR